MQHCEPRVSDYMLKTQTSVRPDVSLKKALSTMRKLKSRYLPVVSGRQVVGLLKANSSQVANSFLGSEGFTVADWMSPGPAVAQPDTGLFEVLDNTPNNVYGCTIVQDAKGNIQGIFTPNEALTAFHDLAAQNRASA